MLESCQTARVSGPYLKAPVEPMPANEQVDSARTQLEWNERSLEGVTWAIHPVDLRELRRLLGEDVRFLGLLFTVAADPELEGVGPRLIWPDEWPESWE